ncbi:MAG: cell division protein ZapA [Proteobacteria bacterium]|nr:cell division protein ZapA [Pseudomonadota bacterium]
MTSSDGQQTPPVHASLSDGEADHAAPKDNNAKTAVNIRLLERDYRLAVTEDEKQLLVDAAQKLDARMREIRDQGKIHAADRIAIMAALEASLENLKISRQLRAQEQAGVAEPPSQASNQDSLLIRMRTLSEQLANTII